VNEEDDMAPDDPRYGPPDPRYGDPRYDDPRYAPPRNPTRRAIDPFVAGVSDGVAHGYQAIENVVWGLQESLRLQTRPRMTRRPSGLRGPYGAGRMPPTSMRGRIATGPPAAVGPGHAGSARGAAPRGMASVHPGAAPRPHEDRLYGPGAVGYDGGFQGGYSRYDRPLGLALLDDVTAVVVDVLNRAAEAARDVADAITEQSHHGVRGEDECIPELALSAAAGAAANVRFTLWNTGAGALRSVRFEATDLLGAAGRIGSKTVSFTPSVVDFVRPGGANAVVVSVAVPEEAVPGVYRGLAQAEPGDSCVVLELTVTEGAPAVSADPSRERAPAVGADDPSTEARPS
jgi:hypothetical protein